MSITLTMIVKDEARTLERTLTSAKPFIDRWVIVDTGSTDGTQELIRKVLAGVPGELHEEPFIDFSTSRNRALDLAGNKTEFVMWLDADDVLEGGSAFREFLKDPPPDDAFFLRVVMQGVAFDSVRVIRSASSWRFEGTVHEVLHHPQKPPPSKRIEGVTVQHISSADSEERSRKRWERDIVLLKKELERVPGHTRATFYLARTYFWLGRYDLAEDAYCQRIRLGGWREEVYESKVDLARVAEQRGDAWAEVQNRWLEAYSFAPHRAEPLFWIASHYRLRDENALAFFFARRAFELPFPAEDRLPVNESIYRWQAADLTAITGWWAGEWEVGEAAARKALKACPGTVHMERNLMLYEDRKKKLSSEKNPVTKTEKSSEKRLHIGCGTTILPGWINLDRSELPGVDVVVDLNACRTTPLPFEDDSISEVYGSHILEHIQDSLALMQELHRVAKPGAIAKLVVPYGASDDADVDPTHVRSYFWGSWVYFSSATYWFADYGYRGDWEVESVTLKVDRRLVGLSWQESFDIVQRERNVVREMVAVLRAVKPARRVGEPRKQTLIIFEV